ncbi:uncharacterized protein B0I36DRAFT_381284 [Microdochium trichocladiopsis]|uniref:F-box domain-containing protein n=1 Tax=Microdochium trichocladiopsis TaxID=1682393 RepID=A0A9P8YHU7_9PEZI|nr:uncharacterized protein B0I36DRAFT_381284 [Microdochium trichocladiopsis]KAH7038229.1 hypothetical protein B0I36DRAFT_381284 [Microdochium trichocladiopsis]
MDVLALPTEVLYQVFDFLREDGDIDSIRASLLVCRAFQGVAEHALYHTIAFRKRSSMEKLAQALEADPGRLRYIQDLELQWSTKEYKHGDLQPPDLAAMLNLRRLLSESPECQPWARRQGQWKPDMQNCLDAFEKASLRSTVAAPRPLEHLLSLTLHWSGEDERFWFIKPSCPIFLHPTLRDIKLSCVGIVRHEADDAEWEAGLDEFRHKTALESLHFEESLVSAQALMQILSLPRALKHFAFEEVSHHRPGVARFLDHLIGHDVDTLNAAFAQQAQSLTCLRIKSSSYLRQTHSSTADITLSLGDFRDLTRLELGDFPAARRSQPWMLAYPLPPNLKQLRITGFGPDNSELVNKILTSLLKVDQLIKNAQARDETFHLDIWLPKIPYWDPMPMDANFARLGPIIVALDGTIIARDRHESDSDAAILPPPESGPDSNRDDAAKTAQPQPHVSIMSVKLRGNYIPPYLHGERRPDVASLFDSRSGWLSTGLIHSMEREQHGYLVDDDDDSSSSFHLTDDEVNNDVETANADDDDDDDDDENTAENQQHRAVVNGFEWETASE